MIGALEHGEATGSAIDMLVVGMRGPLLRWTCEAVAMTAALAKRSLAAELVVADDDWMPPPRQESPAARMFIANEPGQAAMAAVREGRIPALLVVDDPGRALLDMIGAGHPRDVALRSLSASATLLGELAGSPAALVVSAREGARAGPRIQDHVLTRFGVTLSELDASALVESYPPSVSTAQALTAEEASVIEGALAPACRYAITGRREPVAWPRACLYWGDRPGEPAPRVLDLTGPSRVLVYGPYLRLPPGRWIARAMVAFSPECCGAPFSLELHGSAEFGRCDFSIHHPGVFIATWKVEVPSAREALEVRLVSRRGAIEGTLGIDHVEFLPDPG